MSKPITSTTTARSMPCGRHSRSSRPVPRTTGWWRRRPGGGPDRCRDRRRHRRHGPGKYLPDLRFGVGPELGVVRVGRSGRSRPRPVAVPVPGLHNAKNAAVATVAASPPACPSSCGQGTRPVRRGGPALRVPGHGRRGDLRRRLRPLADRGPSGAGGRGQRQVGRVVAVFQPHRYSRTEALWTEFGLAFDDADLVVVTDVYGAGEAPVPGCRVN